MRWQNVLGVCACIFFMCGTAIAKKGVWWGGVRVGLMHPYTELVDEVGATGYGFVRVGVRRAWSVELGWGYGRFDGNGYSTDLWMGENKIPVLFTNDSDTAGWVMTIPVGLGVQLPLTGIMRLELISGYTYTYSDDLNGAILKKGNDTFFNWTAGLTFGHFEKKKKAKIPFKPAPVPVSDSPDDDGDGLTDDDFGV